MSPQRIQRKRTAGWRMPEGAVYVGRPTIYGNPFRIGESFCGPTIRTIWTPIGVVAKFEEWLSHDTLPPLCWDQALVRDHSVLKAALARGDLAGKDLVCWCALDQPCHADVLLRIAAGGAA